RISLQAPGGCASEASRRRIARSARQPQASSARIRPTGRRQRSARAVCSSGAGGVGQASGPGGGLCIPGPSTRKKSRRRQAAAKEDLRKQEGTDEKQKRRGGRHGKRRPDRERERRTQRCRQGAPLCRQQAQTSEDPTRPGQHLHRAAAQRPGDPHPAPSTPSTARSPRRRALEPLEVWENEAPLRHWG
ncbi:unnamed protein product, partial [Prorocentrum cordatum]